MTQTTTGPISNVDVISMTWSESETLPDAGERKSGGAHTGQIRKILGVEKVCVLFIYDESLRPIKTIFIQPIPPFKWKTKSNPSKEGEVTPSKGSPSAATKNISDYGSFGIRSVSVRPPPPKMVILPIPLFKGNRATDTKVEASPSVAEQNPDVRPVCDFRSN